MNKKDLLRIAITNCAVLARAAEPSNGWGTRSTINDAWADGFRMAAVEISDSILKLVETDDDR